MKLLRTASSLLFASLAAAQELTDYTETGVGPQPAGQDYSDAINNPAAQKQVAFSLWDPEDSVAEPPSWSFRTRLAEATIPSEITSIPNARVLNTVYDFQFPNSNNYRDVVAANSGQLNQTSFCVTVLESLLPSGRINAYTEDDSNAYDSCRGPLRDACLESMRKKWMESDWDDAGCRGKDLDLSEIKQCEWTFEGEYEGATYNLLTASNATVANSTSGSGFAHITTDIYDGNNRTFFSQADSRVHMVIIDSGNVFTPLCMRVNNEVRAEGFSTGASNSGDLGANVNLWFIAAAGFVAMAYVL